MSEIREVTASGHLVEEHGPATWSIPFSRVDGPGTYYIVPEDAWKQATCGSFCVGERERIATAVRELRTYTSWGEGDPEGEMLLRVAVLAIVEEEKE